MEGVAIAVIAFEGLVFVTLAGLVIYLIIRRINMKGRENFEHRDN